jgi:hypothetical protein
LKRRRGLRELIRRSRDQSYRGPRRRQSLRERASQSTPSASHHGYLPIQSRIHTSVFYRRLPAARGLTPCRLLPIRMRIQRRQDFKPFETSVK